MNKYVIAFVLACAGIAVFIVVRNLRSIEMAATLATIGLSEFGKYVSRDKSHICKNFL